VDRNVLPNTQNLGIHLFIITDDPLM
jgi:hypothetical protein